MTEFSPFNKGTRWVLPVFPELVTAFQAFFDEPDSYPVDARGVTYSLAFFSRKRLGTGQYYLMTFVDGENEPLNGAAAYRLRVPADAPVSQYWSATVYNRDTHTLIRDVSRAGRSSQSPGLQVSEDGSADIYFGPQPPPGLDSNWVPTDPNGHFEVLFRFTALNQACSTAPGSCPTSNVWPPTTEQPEA